ncbi:Firmicu-CTERM sorting domain-containing protein [Lacticaseibacillus sp. GG6-2]
MRLRYLFGLLALGVGLATAPQVTHAAGNISIDGNFGDWSAYPATSVSYSDDGSGQDVSLIKVAADTKTVDFYVQAHNNNASGGIPAWSWTLTVGGHTLGNFNIGNSATPSGKVTVYYNGQAIGTGDVTRSQADSKYKRDYSTGEFEIDLAKAGISDAKVGDTIALNASSAGLGNQKASANVTAGGASSAATTTTATSASASAASSSSSQATSSSSSSSPVDANGVVTAGDADTTTGDQNTNHDATGIAIDGDFGDWKSVPITKVAGDNVYNSRYMAMVTDGNDVDIYVKMQPNEAIPGYGDYDFDFGGKHVYVWSHDIPSQLTTDGKAEAVTLNGGSNYDQSTYGAVATGYVRRFSCAQGSYDVMEFKLSLAKLHLSTTTSQTITMSNPNVGNGAVTAAGGSTGPVVLASVGVLIAGFGYWKYRKMTTRPVKTRVSGK